jgi:hypothetical protein
MVSLGVAQASTLYTYSFTQDFDFTLGAGFDYPTRLAGGFTGEADASGHINLGTLSDFHLTFDFDPAIGSGLAYGSYLGPPDYFSFLVGDTSGSTLAFQSPLPIRLFSTGTGTACVGAAVAVLCNGGTPRGVVTVSFGAAPAGIFARSEVAPVVTLVSSSTVATTPVPGALLLFTTALGGLGVACAWWRRRSLA